ncbi:MAG: hypothetical protein II937_10050 [Bacteroidales bacterium]|nr:hypothetical protein [Bacteroidales bacterium]
MKTLQVIDKSSGAMLSELVLPPLGSYTVGYEFGDDFSRWLVVRSAYKNTVFDKVEIGETTVELKQQIKDF